MNHEAGPDNHIGKAVCTARSFFTKKLILLGDVNNGPVILLNSNLKQQKGVKNKD
jgi:hypothetical protein